MKLKNTGWKLALKLFSFTFLLCGIVENSMAMKYYIANNGVDGPARNGSMSQPWLTIDYASARLGAGDTLIARGGTYYNQGGYIWHSSGTSAKPITFKNHPGETPVFDGEWKGAGNFITFNNTHWLIFDGITVTHYNDNSGNGSIVFHNANSRRTITGPCTNILVQNCKFIDNGKESPTDHHIYLGKEAKDITIRNSWFVRTPGGAIHAYHTPIQNGIKIYNNVIIGGTSPNYPGTQIWGIIIADGRNAEIFNNTIYDVKRGIDFSYGSADSPGGTYVIKNNLLVNCTEAGICVAASPDYRPYFSSDYNGFYGNAVDVKWGDAAYTMAQFKTSTANERHGVSGNPLFVNAGAQNFHLKSGSPMLKSGTSGGNIPAIDYDYNKRTGRYTIGAYK
jgi:hypothetical protein